VTLGTLLRHQRKEKKFTLKAVSEMVGISEGFLSQVENNVKSPSLETFSSICEAIGIDAGGLLTRLKNQERLFLLRKSEWAEVDIPHTGFATRRFCAPEARTVIDSATLFIESKQSIPVRKGIKNGQEILCLVQGSLELVHGDQTIKLVEGDSVHFWSDQERQSITNTDDELAVAMWVGTL